MDISILSFFCSHKTAIPVKNSGVYACIILMIFFFYSKTNRHNKALFSKWEKLFISKDNKLSIGSRRKNDFY